MKKKGTKQKTTPRPWYLGDDGEACTADCQRITGFRNAAGDDDTLPADKALIIRAVNTHDDLVAACEAALRDLTETVKDCGPCDHAVNICFCGYKRTCDQLRAALALARAGAADGGGK